MTCTWTPDPACLTDEWNGLEDAERERALMLATSSLQTLTYGRVGSCPITVRLTSEEPPCGLWEPYLLAGRWLNTCGCRTAHWSDALNEVTLDGPIGYVESIKVDGADLPLDNDNWRVDNGNILVWQGEGPSPLPKIQDLSKADTEIGTWSITYSQSYPVNADARIAVAYLALEFARACQVKPKTKCSLPRGVTNVARAGVTFTIGDKSLFPGGLTGIDVTDQFILKWAPAGSPTQNAVVFDPSKINQTRRTAALPRRQA